MERTAAGVLVGAPSAAKYVEAEAVGRQWAEDRLDGLPRTDRPGPQPGQPVLPVGAQLDHFEDPHRQRRQVRLRGAGRPQPTWTRQTAVPPQPTSWRKSLERKRHPALVIRHRGVAGPEDEQRISPWHR